MISECRVDGAPMFAHPAAARGTAFGSSGGWPIIVPSDPEDLMPPETTETETTTDATTPPAPTAETPAPTPAPTGAPAGA